MVKADYIDIQRSEKMKALVANELKNFTGEDLGFVSRKSIDKIKGLTANEAYSFLSKLFIAKEKEGQIDINGKVIVYKVNSSKLADNITKEEESSVNDILSKLERTELMNNLINNLKSKYEVISSSDSKE